MTQIHLVLSQKGGVGKTTIAVNLAAIVAKATGSDPANPNVAVVSLDPQGSAVWWAEQGDPDQVPFDFDQMDDRPEQVARLMDNGYDHVFVDSPGSLARPAALAEVLDLAKDNTAKGLGGDVIVPVKPGDHLALDPTERTIRELIEPRGLDYRVVCNDHDPRDGLSSLNELITWIDDEGFRRAETVVRRYKLHRTAAKKGLVVTQYPKGRTRTEALNDFLFLSIELGYQAKRQEAVVSDG